MSGQTNIGNQTSSDDEEDDEFPIAAIVCLGVGAYVILIVGIIIIKQQCSSRGSCKSQCCDANTEEGGGCCTCNLCAAANEACPCCCKCNLDGCLSRVCGKPKKINCIDIILCNCGGCTEKCCNWKCGCCPQDVKCCTGVCTDCCVSDLEPGTCGCLCLEVKLRSPGRDSARRSTSVPNSLQHFNTHSDKISSIQNGRHFDDSDSVITRDSVDGTESIQNKIRLRSSSHSPRHLVVRNRQISQTGESDGGVTQGIGPRENSKHSQNLRKNTTKTSIHSRDEGNKCVFEKSNRVSNTNNNNKDFNKRKNSRLRKSVRTGQRSQRFPNHLLVSAESLNTSDSSDRFETPQVSVRSLPVPYDGDRRPLPAIRKANKTH